MHPERRRFTTHGGAETCGDCGSSDLDPPYVDHVLDTWERGFALPIPEIDVRSRVRLALQEAGIERDIATAIVEDGCRID